MIDLKLLERKAENGTSYFEDYRQGLVNRGVSVEILEKIMHLASKRKETLTQAETAKANQNKLSADVGQLKREGKDATRFLAELEKIKSNVKELESVAGGVDAEVQGLLLEIPNLVLNGVSEKNLPNIVNFSLRSISHEFLAIALDEHGVAVSTKSACNETNAETSHVLEALLASGHNGETSGIRLSFGRQTTIEEVDIFVEKLKQICTHLIVTPL